MRAYVAVSPLLQGILVIPNLFPLYNPIDADQVIAYIVMVIRITVQASGNTEPLLIFGNGAHAAKANQEALATRTYAI
jgi:hypothetical protein